MEQNIDTVISLLEKEGPFEGSFTLGGRQIERVKSTDPRVVVLTRWLLHRDGLNTPEGIDILTRRVTEYGENILYVNFRKPDTDCLEDDQAFYRIKLLTT